MSRKRRHCEERSDEAIQHRTNRAETRAEAARKTLLSAILTTIIGTTPALAHAFLVKSNPPVGATLTTAPKTLLLTFTESLEIPFCTVAVTDSMGMDDAAGKPQPVPGHPEQMLIPLNITMPGKILVTWHALSVDTHKTQGTFSFTVTQ